MSDRLIDKGDKRADKNTSGFECHPGLCFRKGKKKKNFRIIMTFILDFAYNVHLTQVRIKSLFHLPIPIIL